MKKKRNVKDGLNEKRCCSLFNNKELAYWISRHKLKGVHIYSAIWLPLSPHLWVDG